MLENLVKLPGFLDVDLLRRCVDDDALADQGARRAPSPELIGLCASDDQAGPWLPDGKGLHAAPRIQARTWSVVVPTYWAASAARRVSGIALHCSSRSRSMRRSPVLRCQSLCSFMAKGLLSSHIGRASGRERVCQH